MSESLGDNPHKKVGIKEGERLGVSSGIYNLPAKVAGITRKLQESPNIGSNRALEKRLRGLDHKCRTMLQSVGDHKSEYAGQFGEDVVDRAEEELKQLSIKIREIGSQRAADARDKRIKKLRGMGYGA